MSPKQSILTTILEALYSPTAGLLVTWPGNLFIEPGSEEHKIYLKTLSLNEEEVATGDIRALRYRRYDWKKIGVGLIHRIPLMSIWEKGKISVSPKTYNDIYKKKAFEVLHCKILDPTCGTNERIFDIQQKIDEFDTEVNFPYTRFNNEQFQAIHHTEKIDHLILPDYEILRIFLFAHTKLTKQLFLGNLWNNEVEKGFCMTENLSYVDLFNEDEALKPKILLENKLYEDQSNALLRILYDPYVRGIARTLTDQYLTKDVNLFNTINVYKDAPLTTKFPLSWPVSLTITGKTYHSSEFGVIFIGHEIKKATITSPIDNCEIDFVNDHNTIVNFNENEDGKDESQQDAGDDQQGDKTVREGTKAPRQSAISVTLHECIAIDNIVIKKNLEYTYIESEKPGNKNQDSEEQESSTDDGNSGNKKTRKEVGKPDKNNLPEPLKRSITLIRELLDNLKSDHNITLGSTLNFNEYVEIEGITFSTFKESMLWSRGKPSKRQVALLQLATPAGEAFLLEPLRFEETKSSRTYLVVKRNLEPISDDDLAILIVNGQNAEEEKKFLEQKAQDYQYLGYRYNHHPPKDAKSWAKHIATFINAAQSH